MKVIFLDVDGVLNNSTLLYHYGLDYIDAEMTELVASLVKSTGAKVVLSSSWRLHSHSEKTVRDFLADYGVEIMDVTPHLPRKRRCLEISRWLADHLEVTYYAIIDDDPHAGVGMEDCFFMTDPENGLDIRTAEAVLDHLSQVS